MSAQRGFAPLALLLIALLLVALIYGIDEVIMALRECGDLSFQQCIGLKPNKPSSEEAQKNMAMASGKYSFEDYGVTISADIPLDGGKVSGKVSGTCNGRLSGSYDGKDNGKIQGTLQGSCTIPLIGVPVKVPASADFNGIVAKGQKKVPIEFTGKGAGVEHSGSLTLTY